MAAEGFHNEWVTIGQHRVLLSCRDSFPDQQIRFIAEVAAATCDNNSFGRARVVQVFYDDKSCIWTVDVASTDPTDESLEETLLTVFHTMYGHGNVQPQVTIVPEGNTDSDHYNRTEHLSRSLDV